MNTIKKIWLYSFFVKILLAILLPLSHDETYYWVWSHNLQLSYFDHPAMVSWLFWLGHLLEPIGNAVRLPAVALGHLSLLFWILILRKFYDVERAQSWLWISLLSPLIGFGSILLTPDLPLIFFWSAATYFFLEALENQKLRNYILLGASLGLGFCSKYHIVLFVPIIFTYLHFEKKWKELKAFNVLALLLTGFVFSLPVLIWNYQSDFSSFRFQLAHGLERPAYEVEWTFSYILGQIMLLFPLVFWRACRAKVAGPARFLIYAAWGPLLFFLITSFRALVEANWAIAAFPAVFFLAVLANDHKRVAYRTCLGWLAIYGLALLILLIPNLEVTARLKEPSQFQVLLPLVKEYRPLYASTYQMASSLWYNTKNPIYKLSNMNRHDFFDTLDASKPTGELFYLVMFVDDYVPEWVRMNGWEIKELKKIDSHFVLLEIKKL